VAREGHALVGFAFGYTGEHGQWRGRAGHRTTDPAVREPLVVLLYGVIRLAVRHGMEDAQRIRQGDRKRAEISETIRRHESASGGSAHE
jgi:hypothetical protein